MPDHEKITDALRALQHKVEAWWPGDAGVRANTLKEDIDAILARCGEERLMYETPQGDMVDYEPPPRWPRWPHYVIETKEATDA